MDDADRKYKFNWDIITGNLETARPRLGSHTRVEVYRLFQFTLRDVLEQRYGSEEVDTIFREAGKIAGTCFFENFCEGITDLSNLVIAIQTHFHELGIGIFRIEKADPERGLFQFTVAEDLDCSGMPDTEDQICVYDEGFLSGILKAFTGRGFEVREIDCWCKGERTCRFEAKAIV